MRLVVVYFFEAKDFAIFVETNLGFGKIEIE